MFTEVETLMHTVVEHPLLTHMCVCTYMPRHILLCENQNYQIMLYVVQVSMLVELFERD